MSERILSFRPFRRVGGKLVVTSYMGWYKIYCANYEGATVKLLPFPEIKKGETIYAMGKPEGLYGYWHPTKFEPLFWREEEDLFMFDCSGCPTFSHKTVVFVSENYPKEIHSFEPLTADIVYKYFEIMRDNLENIKWINNKIIKT